MSIYVDSSVVLRFVLEQPGRLEGLQNTDELVTSVLTGTECLRAIDNANQLGSFTEDEYLARRAAIHSRLRAMTTVGLSESVLAKAGEPLPVPLKTLDAIHLATACLWRIQTRAAPAFATHDRRLASAAAALGFQVIGT